MTTELHFIAYIGTLDRKTDKLFHFTPHIDIKVRQNDKPRFISPRILESTGAKQTDKLRFISPLISESTQYKQMTN